MNYCMILAMVYYITAVVLGIFTDYTILTYVMMICGTIFYGSAAIINKIDSVTASVIKLRVGGIF